jgi:hypothetical protein
MGRLAALLLVPLALAGCSGSQNQAESAGGAVDTLVKSCAADRPSDALEVLTRPARNAFTRAPSTLDGCLELLGLRFPGVSRPRIGMELRATRVVSVHANDLSATAELRAPEGNRSRVELEKSRGVWSVSD